MAGHNLLLRALRQGRGPLTADIQDLVNGPSHTFFVEAKSGWSANEIDRLLRSRGVHVWGELIVADEIMFTVRQAQARWAQYLLERAGVPIKPGSAYCATMGLSVPQPRVSIWVRLETLFDELMDELGF
jgi:hypothetical protein